MWAEPYIPASRVASGQRGCGPCGAGIGGSPSRDTGLASSDWVGARVMGHFGYPAERGNGESYETSVERCDRWA